MKSFLILLILGFITLSFAAKITAPKECEKWYSGHTYKIKWETDDLDDTVNIEFYEDDDTLIQVIAENTDNDGEFEWTVPFFQTEFSECDPYIFISSSSGYSLDYFITGDDAVRSKAFSLINPIIWGSANVDDAANVADTLFKVRWTGERVYDYEIEYRELGSSNSETVHHTYDRYPDEDLDDHVIPALRPKTTYEFRMRFRVEDKSKHSDWTEWQRVTTYDTLRCTDEMLSAWFSLEVYDSLRSGEFAYPGFCGGEWETAHSYTSVSDFAAIWTDRLSKRIIVAWRGTEGDNWEDAIDNLGYLSGCSNYIEWEDDDCKVSYGFGTNYHKTDWEHFDEVLSQAVDAGFDQLIVTGHSQGAALATIAALDYELRFGDRIRVSLINFGAPEVGNDVFTDVVSDTLKSIKQYSLIDESGEQDEVTLLPSSIIDVGFVPLEQGYSFLECPSTCRENGLGVLSPFYCHCIVGYWDRLATDNLQPGYVFNGSNNPVPADWLSGDFEDHQSVSDNDARSVAASLSGSALLAIMAVALVALF